MLIFSFSLECLNTLLHLCLNEVLHIYNLKRMESVSFIRARNTSRTLFVILSLRYMSFRDSAVGISSLTNDVIQVMEVSARINCSLISLPFCSAI